MKNVTLGIESSGEYLSLALVSEGAVVEQHTLTEARKHSEQIGPLVQDLIGNSKDDLACVAISAGPGSYTGLRIGCSMAKGLCFSLDLALVSVNSLHACALAQLDLATPGKPVFSVFPSRRGEVYISKFDSKPKISEEIISDSLLIDEFSEWSGAPKVDGALYVGPGAERLNDAIVKHGYIFEIDANVTSNAVAVATLGERRFKEGLVEDLESFQPLYLKTFVAKRGTPIFERLEKSRKSN